MLFFPFHPFDHFIDLLREASIDPYVTSIQITLYRLARNSSVINALLNAVRNGKSVTTVVELQARFDEEANILWGNKLREEGVKVIYGVPGLKVHSKLCLITRTKAILLKDMLLLVPEILMKILPEYIPICFFLPPTRKSQMRSLKPLISSV